MPHAGDGEADPAVFSMRKHRAVNRMGFGGR